MIQIYFAKIRFKLNICTILIKWLFYFPKNARATAAIWARSRQLYFKRTRSTKTKWYNFAINLLKAQICTFLIKILFIFMPKLHARATAAYWARSRQLHPLTKSLFSLFQYSGFQQTSEKCGICGHLIMEMVINSLLIMINFQIIHINFQ